MRYTCHHCDSQCQTQSGLEGLRLGFRLKLDPNFRDPRVFPLENPSGVGVLTLSLLCDAGQGIRRAKQYKGCPKSVGAVPAIRSDREGRVAAFSPHSFVEKQTKLEPSAQAETRAAYYNWQLSPSLQLRAHVQKLLFTKGTPIISCATRELSQQLALTKFLK